MAFVQKPCIVESMSTNERLMDREDTEVGSYFVANYPPFSVWSQDAVTSAAESALKSESSAVPLGIYLHIPFCRSGEIFRKKYKNFG